MADDGGGNGKERPTPTTPPPSPARTPRRPRRAGATSPSKISPAAAATASSSLPPPPTPTPPTPTVDHRLAIGSSSSATISLTPRSKRSKSVICPICQKDMCHEKALCGHIRWHTPEQRQAASVDIARALSASYNDSVHGGGDGGDGDEGPSKKFKLPDLNKSPPPEEE